MFLHIGKNIVVNTRDIIAIIDISGSAGSKDTDNFISIAEEEGFVERVSGEEVKSVIISERTEKIRKSKKTSKSVIYFSPISSATLCKRANFIKGV
jgi:hypothetical protein